MYKALTTIVLSILLASTAASHAHNVQHPHSAQHADEVAYNMKKMKRAYRNALRSDDIEQMKPAVAQLLAISKNVATLDYGINRTEQADYREGMQQLQAGLALLNAAVEANDFALAQKILREQIKATRNQSHEKLGVDEY